MFTVEMQATNQYNTRKRSRYIHSIAMATSAESPFIDRIHRQVLAIKADKKKGAKYMKFEKLMQRQHEDGKDPSS